MGRIRRGGAVVHAVQLPLVLVRAYAVKQVRHKRRRRVRSAKDRVARDRQRRVRKHRHRHAARRALAAARSLADLHIVFKSVRVAVDVRRLVDDHAVRCARYLHAVPVPRVHVRVLRRGHALARMGRHLHLAAVAYRRVVHAQRRRRVLGRLHRHLRRVLAVARRLRHHDPVVRVVRHRARRVAPLRSTRNLVRIGHLALVPLVHKARDVRVVHRRCQRRNAALADGHHRVDEGHLGSLVHVHRVSLARSRAAARGVGHNHRIHIGRVAALVRAVALGRVHHHVVQSPCVAVGHAADAVVQVRNKIDVLAPVGAHILVAADRHRRHRSDKNRVTFHFRSTTTAGDRGFHTIYISGITRGLSRRDISVVGVCCTSNLNTILIPSIGNRFCRKNFRSEIPCRKHNFHTTANCIRNIVSNFNSGNRFHLNLHRIHCGAKTVTGSFNFCINICCRSKRMSICIVRSIRYLFSADKPLIGDIVVTVGDASLEGNFAILTDRGIGSHDFRNRGSIHIHCEGFAFHAATVLASDKGREGVSAGSKGFSFRICITRQRSFRRRNTVLAPSNL